MIVNAGIYLIIDKISLIILLAMIQKLILFFHLLIYYLILCNLHLILKCLSTIIFSSSLNHLRIFPLLFQI